MFFLCEKWGTERSLEKETVDTILRRFGAPQGMPNGESFIFIITFGALFVDSPEKFVWIVEASALAVCLSLPIYLFYALMWREGPATLDPIGSGPRARISWLLPGGNIDLFQSGRTKTIAERILRVKQHQETVASLNQKLSDAKAKFAITATRAESSGFDYTFWESHHLNTGYTAEKAKLNTFKKAVQSEVAYQKRLVRDIMLEGKAMGAGRIDDGDNSEGAHRCKACDLPVVLCVIKHQGSGKHITPPIEMKRLSKMLMSKSEGLSTVTQDLRHKAMAKAAEHVWIVNGS